MTLWPKDQRAGENLSILEMKFHLIMRTINQWSATFLGPGTGFREDYFSTDRGGDGFGRIWTYSYIVYFICTIITPAPLQIIRHQIPEIGFPCLKSYNHVFLFVSICPSLVPKWSQSSAIPSLPPVFFLLCSSFLPSHFSHSSSFLSPLSLLPLLGLVPSLHPFYYSQRYLNCLLDSPPITPKK